MNNWQKLCEQVIPLIKNNVTEDLFHILFESALKTIFNWDSNSIQHKMPVPMGRDVKEADIVLKGINYGIVVEMKKPFTVLGDRETGQLTSYMRILGYKYGFLISNEFQVFYDDDTRSNVPILIASFGFDPNNSDGISLGNILDRDICSNEKLKEFAIMHIERIQTQQEMDRLKNELLNSNGEKIKGIIKDRLLTDGYDESSIDNIIKNIDISYKSSNNQQIIFDKKLQNTNDTDEPHSNDNTRYNFMGNIYGKSRLVLAIIEDYIQHHNDCTLENLKTIFPKKLQGALGVIDTFESANEIYKRTKHKRHFLNNKITLRSGQEIVVCTQWGIGNINEFINKAKELGFDIKILY